MDSLYESNWSLTKRKTMELWSRGQSDTHVESSTLMLSKYLSDGRLSYKGAS